MGNKFSKSHTRRKAQNQPPQMYKYKPLQSPDSIRLVRLEPGDWFQDVRCTIIHETLSSKPSYEALSYVWGSPINPKTIYCGDSQHRLFVTANCESALRRLRKRTTSRLLWVDAICIDQSNIEERSMQVRFMGEIYRSATQVVIDLGLHTEDSTFAIEVLKTIVHGAQYAYETHLRVYSAMDELYSRPWFSRGWVLQESFMAQKAIVLYGETTEPWELFRPIYIKHVRWPEDEMPPNVQVPKKPPYMLGIGNHSSNTYTAEKDLLTLLYKTRHCSTTDPRDKLFAILPMITNASKLGLVADYSKSVAEVYTNVATFLLQHHGLKLLTCNQGTSNIADLPSWVPDWTIQVDRDMYDLSSICRQAAAGTSEPAVFEIHSSENEKAVLKVRGTNEGPISTFSDILKDHEDEEKVFEDWVTRALAGDDPEFRDPHFLTILNRGDYGQPRYDSTLEKRLPDDYLYVLVSREVDERMDSTCNGRRLFLTAAGHLAVGPAEMQKGDLVCILLGCGVPYVLRDVDDHYILVGECFVYGMMDGDYLKEGLASDSCELVDFMIH